MREEADKIEAALCRLGDGEAIPSDAFPLLREEDMCAT